ncbi:hypothetical protein OSTOST_17514 [Ostertagia ostertagi]
MTNARLEASFEMQKQTTAVVEKELERARKETDQIREENDRLRAGDAQMASRVEQLHQELMGLQTQTSNYKIELRAVTEELQHARLTINRLETEAEARKRTSFSEQQMMLSLNEMTTRLSRVESEKTAHLGSQLDVVRLERDSLKTSNARLTDQLSNSRNDAKQAQARYEEEISLLRQQLAEKEKELALCERQLIDLRARLSNIQAQYTAQESTVGMTPERLQKECQQLKNRSQYLLSVYGMTNNLTSRGRKTVYQKSNENASHGNEFETNGRVGVNGEGTSRSQGGERRSDSFDELTASSELSTKFVQLENEMSDIKMDQLQQSSQLQLKIDILEAQIKDADNSVSELNVSLNSARGEIERRVSECNEAEENLRATETTLAARLEEMSAAEVKYNEGIKEYEMKLEQLLEKYENVVAQMTETSSSVEMKDVNDISMNAETSVIESNEECGSFLARGEAKGALDAMRHRLSLHCTPFQAISRSMTAEVEVKRLRAEVAEIRSNRDELAATVQSLQSEAMANANALAEKPTGKLDQNRVELAVEHVSAERLERWLGQRQNTVFRNENEKLHKVSSELSKQKRELETKLEGLVASSNEASSKITMLSSELAAS